MHRRDHRLGMAPYLEPAVEVATNGAKDEMRAEIVAAGASCGNGPISFSLI